MKTKPLNIVAALIAATLFPDIGQAGSLLDQSQTVTVQPSGGGELSNLLSSTAKAAVIVPPTSVPGVSTAEAKDGQPVRTGRDYSVQTASIAPSAGTAVATPDGSALSTEEAATVCPHIQAPPRILATRSKYKQDDASRSSIDQEAQASRDRTVQPIRNSVRALTTLAYASSEDLGVSRARAACVLENIDRWAKAGALTEMKTTDAYLTRDRWIAEIALAVRIAGERAGTDPSRQKVYADWFGTLAKTTVEAYSLRLGPKSRTNNHRYWAGLSVAAIGYLLNDTEYKSWGKMSFEIGACQVDKHGLLPTELARGERALDYHVYALRPLAAILKLSEDAGEAMQSKCLDGFQRLASRTYQALQDPSEFEKLAGLRQTTTDQENSYSAALQLNALPIYQ